MKNASLTLNDYAQSVVCIKAFDKKRSMGKRKVTAGGLGHHFTEENFENVPSKNAY